MTDYIQELRLKVSNVDIFFQLTNLLKLLIKSCPENPTDVIFQNFMTNQTLPESLKSKFHSVSGLFDHFEFDANESECEFTQTQNEAKLIFKDEENLIYEISFLPQVKEQQKLKDQENSELKRIQEQQNQLDRNIAILQEELKRKKRQRTQLSQKKAKIQQGLFQKARYIQKTLKNQVKVNIQKSQKYTQLINYKQKGKMKLQMSHKSVTDQMVQEITQFALKGIQILSLGGNQITDIGFNLLFQNMEWPVLQTIFLWRNKIENIHSIDKIPNLQKFQINQNELSEESCSYLCEHQWPKLTNLTISFKKGLNDKCWRKLLTAMPHKFLKLKNLMYSQQEDISRENQVKIQKYCKEHSIQLN